MQPLPPYTIFPLGDSALTVDFGNRIDKALNELVISLYHHMTKKPPAAMQETVPAYSSLTLYYNFFEADKKKQPGQTVFEWMKEQVASVLETGFITKNKEEKLVNIPVCYEDEFATDIKMIAAERKITAEDIIKTHTSGQYRVYMLGFLPGFAYMGEVGERISIARKQQPVNVMAGSVGIAGGQTGIYPLDSPGGWQIIGRTPLKMFTAPSESSPMGKTSGQSCCLLQPGDTVKFYSITKDEFEDIKSRHT